MDGSDVNCQTQVHVRWQRDFGQEYLNGGTLCVLVSYLNVLCKCLQVCVGGKRSDNQKVHFK